jgi:hypothetical protein
MDNTIYCAATSGAHKGFTLECGGVLQRIQDFRAGFSQKPFRVELPILVAVGAEPMAAIVMIFVSEADGDPMARVRKRDARGLARVPSVLGRTRLLGRALFGEGWQGRAAHRDSPVRPFNLAFLVSSAAIRASYRAMA